MKINRRTVLTGTAAVAGSSVLGGRLALAADPIRLGAILPLSGNAELVGSRLRLGMEIARDQINAAGGVLGRQIEIVFHDDKGDPNQSVAAARSLTSSGINLILGPALSAQGVAVTGIIQSLNSVMLTMSMPLDSLTHELYNRNFFRLADNNYMRCRALARAMAERFPDVTHWGGFVYDLAVGLDSWKVFTQGLREFYPKYAKKEPVILDVTTFKFGSTDYKTQIFRAMQSPAQGMYNLTYGSDMLTLWKQAKTLGFSDKLKVVADGSGELDMATILAKDLPPELWSNVHWFYGNTSNKVNEDLVREIRARSKDPHPSSLIGPAHGAVYAYAAAIKAANSTATNDVIEALEKVTVDTAKGTVRFRKEDHQAIGPVNLVGSVPTASGFEFKAHVEIPGAEIIEPPSPGAAIKL